MALQVCVNDGTPYPGVAGDGSAAMCPQCGGNAWNPADDAPPGAEAVPDSHEEGPEPASEPEPAPVSSVPPVVLPKPVGAGP